jgi:hypothetical protein
VHVTFSLSPPISITNLFGNWLWGIATQELMQIQVEVCAIFGLRSNQNVRTREFYVENHSNETDKKHKFQPKNLYYIESVYTILGISHIQLIPRGGLQRDIYSGGNLGRPRSALLWFNPLGDRSRSACLKLASI